MKSKNDNQIKRSGNFKSIRIKNDTKNDTKNVVDKKLGLINKSDEFGKINYDRLIQFGCSHMAFSFEIYCNQGCAD